MTCRTREVSRITRTSVLYSSFLRPISPCHCESFRLFAESLMEEQSASGLLSLFQADGAAGPLDEWLWHHPNGTLEEPIHSEHQEGVPESKITKADCTNISDLIKLFVENVGRESMENIWLTSRTPVTYKSKKSGRRGRRERWYEDTRKRQDNPCHDL